MDFDHLADAVAKLFTTVEQQNLLGMQEICLYVQQNLSILAELEQNSAEVDLVVSSFFQPLAETYLSDAATVETVDSLLDCLEMPVWPMPITGETRSNLREILIADRMLLATAQDVPPVVEAAHVIDVSVAIEEQSVSHELIGMLSSEATRIQYELEQLLGVVGAASEPSEHSMEALAHYSELLGRLCMAAEAVGLTSLKSYLEALLGCVSIGGGLELSAAQLDALSHFPGAIQTYLAAPRSADAVAGLIAILQADAWGGFVSAKLLADLSQALALVTITADAESIPERQALAEPKDVSLAVPSDIDQALLDGLLQELPIQSGDFSKAIQRISAGHGTLKDVDAAKRAAHTLKGAANTVGIKGIANLTHHVEDILVSLGKYQTLPGRNLANMLTRAGDCLEAMGEAVVDGGGAPPDALGVLQEVLDWANRIDREGVPEDDAAVTVSTPAAASAQSVAPSSTPAPTAGEAESGGAHAGAVEATVRVPASLVDELLRLVGETIISTGQVKERLQRLERQNKFIREQNRVFLQLAAKLEDQVDMRGAAGKFTTASTSHDFDPLEFEHYSELHTISRQLIETATDSSELSGEVEGELGNLGEVINVQNRLHEDTQNAMMRLRMVPVTTVESRLQRCVRQTSRLVDKEVSLKVLGAETMVDANILNDLVDPMMHMLRNSIDHGIENSEKRIEAGKSREGNITLRFSREGNQIVIRCRDDGAGIDLGAVRRKAEGNGLITTDQTLTDDELARLVLAPGFSTRNESTQVSGRGVGMDVVYSRVLELKGSLNLKSERGRGLEIEISLPATLISTHALLVNSLGKVFAISSYGVQDIRYVTPDQLQQVGTEYFLRVNKDLVPLVALEKLLNVRGDRRNESRESGFPALLVRDDAGSLHAVHMQEIIDSRSLVVKGLGRYVPRPHGVVGATILGDGSVAAVLDIPELMRKPAQYAKRSVGAMDVDDEQAFASTPQRRRTALVVDDSISARRATVQFMKDAGFEVRSAIDGIDAVAILNKWTPSIMLVDMEMPRMNGLELTAHVRSRTDTLKVPIIMITSRSTEKHRSQAKTVGVNVYLTKPFSDDELLHHVADLTGA